MPRLRTQPVNQRMRPSKEAVLGTGVLYACGVCGFLLMAIALIYGQTLSHKLLDYDDSGFVFANPHVTPGLTLAGVRWAFTDGPYGEWYPLTMLSHMLDCQLYGPEAWGHHLTNVLLHAAASIALFLVLWRMTAELWPSAFVATLFAVHPQHVESVAWVAERRDVLSGLFFMLTLAAYLAYMRHGRPFKLYLLVAAMLALSLMAKPMAVTLPPLLLLLDFWPLARIGRASDSPGWTYSLKRASTLRLVIEKIPLAALAAGACVLTLRTHAHGGISLAWSERIGNAAIACVSYVVQFFCPVGLAVFYPIPAGGPALWKVIAAVAILGATSVAAVIWRRRLPYFFVGWFWYLGMLTPVLGLVQVAHHAMADRYTYLPCIGLSIAFTWGVARLVAGSPERRRALGGCAAVAIVILLACSSRQTSFWRDDETLWRHALACTTDNGEAELGLADVLAQQGSRDEAVDYYRRAEQHPTDSSPFNNLGSLLAREGNLEEANAQFRQALAIEPDSVIAHVNLAKTLKTENRFNEAREHFDHALEINPLDSVALYGLAQMLLLQEKIDEARVALEKAAAVDPKNPMVQSDLGSVLFNQGEIDSAIKHFKAAVASDPKSILARMNLAEGFAARGKIDEALAQYRGVMALDPDNQVAREECDKLLRRISEPSSL